MDLNQNHYNLSSFVLWVLQHSLVDSLYIAGDIIKVEFSAFFFLFFLFWVWSRQVPLEQHMLH